MIRNRLKQILPQELKNWIRHCLLRREEPPGPVLVDRAQADRIAVLAPHPDDDVIGCGGTLHKHCLAGDCVTVIYLTDGARGDDWTAPPSARLAATRMREAEEAAGVIGVDDLVFLNYTDGKLTADNGTAERILEALTKADPQCVFLPFFLDNHPDHEAANRIFSAAAPRLQKAMEVYAYEVWTPLVPNRLVDISSAAAVKEEAIRKHVSQMKHMDHVGTTLGLNRFRSKTVAPGQGLFEAFLAMDAIAYAKLVDQILGTKER